MVSAGGRTSPQEVGVRPKDVTTRDTRSAAMRELSDLDLGTKRLKYGDIVAGTVVRAEPREILIDIGAKSEGIVDQKELEKMSAEAVKKIQAGDRVLVFVLRPETREGNVVLSLARAQLEREWREAEQLLKSEQVFETKSPDSTRVG